MPIDPEMNPPPIYEQWRSIMLLFPAISFAFSFECSVLPVHEASRKKDPTGKRSYTACVRCLTIVLLYYGLLLIHSLIYGEGILQPELSEEGYSDCTKLFNLSIIDMVQALDYSGNTVENSSLLANYFAMTLMVCFTIQSVL